MDEESATALRVGVVASDPLRRIGIEAMFEALPVREDGRRYAVTALTGNAAVDPYGLVLVVLDAACTPSPLELIAAFQQREPALRLLVMGLERTQEYIERVIDAGARGYLTHDATEAEIRMAIEIVLDGSVWAPRKVLARLLERNRRERQHETEAKPVLTPRERDVLDLLREGGSNREIGDRLAIDEATVKAHVGRLMRKLGVSNRTALIVRATELGLWEEEAEQRAPAGAGTGL